MVLVGRPSPGCGDFEFDLVNPLFQQIREALDAIAPVPLTPEYVDEVADKPGVYMLCLNETIVYVGKADARVSTRLKKHMVQVSGRVGLKPEEMSFRCIYLANTWNPFKPEEQFIKDLTPEWNHSGFGMNEPGRNRWATELKGGHWHRLYPPDVEWRCSSILPKEYTVDKLLRAVSKYAPYWVKAEGIMRGKSKAAVEERERAMRDFEKASPIRVPEAGMTVRELLLLAVNSLPDPAVWQITVTPTHILFRRENRSYPLGRRLWP